jgi:hypothetical protein
MFEFIRGRRSEKEKKYHEDTLLLGAFSAYLIDTDQMDRFEEWARENQINIGWLT